jgi:hypothetical protein
VLLKDKINDKLTRFTYEFKELLFFKHSSLFEDCAFERLKQ